MIDIGLDLKSEIVNNNNQASKVLKKIGLQIIIRPALGGLGGGIAKTRKDYFKIVKNGLHESPVNKFLLRNVWRDGKNLKWK